MKTTLTVWACLHRLERTQRASAFAVECLHSKFVPRVLLQACQLMTHGVWVHSDVGEIRVSLQARVVQSIDNVIAQNYTSCIVLIKRLDNK